METPIYNQLQLYLAKVRSQSGLLDESMDEKALIAEATEKFIRERIRTAVEKALAGK
jgi:hypothetical protein